MHSSKNQCRQRAVRVLCAATLALSVSANAEPSRAELLYTTHCVACHTQQVHWRDQRLAFDWNSLAHQVDRWQSLIQLNWPREDVEAVAAYLNDRYYHFQPRQEKPAMLNEAQRR